jgi:elongation factor G
MKEYPSADLRTFAIVGHASSGKTMLSEAMLACSGAINRMGSIAHGSTVSDYHADEQKRKISIHASVLCTEWLDKKLNIIDTPGYLDFISEALSALRVSDFALVVVNAGQGIELGTTKVWDFATKFEIPKILALNLLDKENLSFDECLAHLRQKWGDRVFPMTVPVKTGPGFNQLLDVMRSEVITYQTDGSGKYQEAPATGELGEKVKQWHQQLIELVAESDDQLMEKFFDQGGLSESELREALHGAVQKQAFLPLFCTAGGSNVGVARLLDFITKFGATPVDRPAVKSADADTQIKVSDPDPVLYVFKTISESHVGDLSFFRLYSGSIQMGMDLLNSSRSTSERVGQIFVMNGKNRTAINRLNAGDIGAVVKLRNTHTGDTLCQPKKPVLLTKVVYPKTNIHVSLKLKSKGEEEKIAVGLSALHDEDPTFIYEVDSELHQTVISGQGDLHLEVISDRLKTRYKVDFDLVEPRVRYRETIKAKADAKYRHKKQTGGAGQFAEVWMRIEPKPRDTSLEFTQTLTGQNVDRGFVPSVEKGVMSAVKEGVLAGYRVVDLKVDFYDGKMHPVDSNDISFQIAGKQAFKDAFMQARPCLLEPIYNVEVRIPEECMGSVVGDLSSRRGKITGMDSQDGFQIVKATVPAMELYRYSTALRSLTGGRGIHSEELSHYEEMPRELEQKIIAKSKEEKEKAQAGKAEE